MRKSALLLAFVASSLPLFASPVTLNFGPPNFVWTKVGPDPGVPNYIWTAGDSWEQTFTGTSLSSANSLTLNLFYNDNTLRAVALNLLVSLNGTSVGTFSINPGNTGFNAYTFSFASNLGPTYDIKISATNTIPVGVGAVSLGANGSNSNALLNNTPEPATLCLLAAGLGAVGGLRRKLLRR